MSIKIALLGCGTVGTEVARLLKENKDIFTARAGDELELIGISVRNLDAPRDPIIDRDLLTDDAEGLIEKADIVIELIGGIEPPRSLVLKALNSGKSVVTGNKALLAAHGPELYEAAAANDVDIYYEAAVAGAVPVVYALRESMTGDRVLSVHGILNGTTNYILDEMTTKGLSYETALAQAQALGYAEADPTADVDGHDAAAKIAILASLAFHKRVSIDDVYVEGIRNVTAADIATAKAMGYVIKLIATTQMISNGTNNGIEVRVSPTMVPLSNPLASVQGSFNAVTIEGAAADRLTFHGRGAGGAPTASAVLSDVIAAAAKIVGGGRAPKEIVYGDTPILDPCESRSRYFITVVVQDVIGTLAAVADVFAEAGVSVSAIMQTPVREEGAEQDPADAQYLTITTHEAKQCEIEETVRNLEARKEVDRVIRMYRVEAN
ncbi:MAG: homoserine dehydrogenase [Actinomycetaceae bacterium]|nr:homoserine dehydrogenase [Actinomycetaceae bacterium]